MSEFPITVFYHCYIPPTNTANFWYYWVDDQLGIIEKSGLSKVADIKMCITMPRYWTGGSLKDKEKTFEEIVTEYINFRYPFVDIIDIRDTMDDNLFEGQTFQKIHTYCINNKDKYIVYFHTKGVFNYRLETKLWRNILDEVMINQWQCRYFDIKDHDCIGISYYNDETKPILFSGNYFWAKSDYISTLSFPYSDDRYYYEKWIFEKNPKVKFVLDFNHLRMYDEVNVYNMIR